MKPHLQELFEAARRELRYRVALGDFGPDLLTAEELVDETLARAWRDRRRRPPLLKFRVWLLAVLFRVAEAIARDEAQFSKLATESLEAPVPPEPFYDDDESFWEWYQPDELTRWEDVVADPSSLSPEDAVAAYEQLTRSLDPCARQVFVLHECRCAMWPRRSAYPSQRRSASSPRRAAWLRLWAAEKAREHAVRIRQRAPCIHPRDAGQDPRKTAGVHGRHNVRSFNTSPSASSRCHRDEPAALGIRPSLAFPPQR